MSTSPSSAITRGFTVTQDMPRGGAARATRMRVVKRALKSHAYTPPPPHADARKGCVARSIKRSVGKCRTKKISVGLKDSIQGLMDLNLFQLLSPQQHITWQSLVGIGLTIFKFFLNKVMRLFTETMKQYSIPSLFLHPTMLTKFNQGLRKKIET